MIMPHFNPKRGAWVFDLRLWSIEEVQTKNETLFLRVSDIFNTITEQFLWDGSTERALFVGTDAAS